MSSKVHLTPQRKMVYEMILRAEDHPTATEIMDRLRNEGYKLAYGTVYNSLHYLTDAGYLRELKIGETATRYDARTEAHHHIVCTVCGKLDELFIPVPDTYFESVADETKYLVEDIDVVVKGVCPSCRSSH